MKKFILFIALLCTLHASDITLTQEQQKDWQLSVSIPTTSNITPKATLFVEVVTPPQLLKTLSLPNDVIITDLHVNLYDNIKHGDALVNVSSAQWLEAQKETIAKSIEFEDAKQNDARQQKLCAEEIIAQKECIASHATFLKAKSALKASKELLRSLGAKESMINAIADSYKVYPKLTLYSAATGNIIQNNTAVGKSILAHEPLMSIQEDGDLWLEGALSVNDAMTLHQGDIVTVALNGQMITSKIINIAPVINVQSQTRNIRLSIKASTSLLAGLRTSATLYLHKSSLKIPKKAVIQDGENSIVFVQNAMKYSSIAVNILAEEKDIYFVEPLEALKNPIALTSVAILKNMMDTQSE